MQQLLKDRKDASIARHGKSKRERNYKFNSPIFVIIEEAHVFIPKDHDTSAKYWAAKIAREGRKIWIGFRNCISETTKCRSKCSQPDRDHLR